MISNYWEKCPVCSAVANTKCKTCDNTGIINSFSGYPRTKLNNSSEDHNKPTPDVYAGKPPLKYLIDTIVDNFDFKKVSDTMQVLKWEWAGSFNPYKLSTHSKATIPMIEIIKDEAIELLTECYEKECTISCGGLCARYCDGEMSLSFIVESFSAGLE